jgi:hypothetical protein
MNWQQFLSLIMLMAGVVFFVWRSSGKKSGCSGHGDCAHDHVETADRKNVVR